MFNTSGGATPFMKGSGYHSFYAKRATRAEAPKLDAALSQNYLSLVETLKYMWKSNGRTATWGVGALFARGSKEAEARYTSPST